ncbi:MAG: hypothetical protein AAFZ38_00325 [Myxococcota bacterium]
MMRKPLCLSLVAALVGFGLAACGDEDDPTEMPVNTEDMTPSDEMGSGDDQDDGGSMDDGNMDGEDGEGDGSDGDGMGGDGMDDDAMDSDAPRFSSELVGPMDMELLNDEETGLTWVNDVRGCFAGITTPGTQCDDLTFAGRTDWRMPNTEELSELLSEIAARDMTLNYINAACAVMTASDGWVFTENSSMPGGVSQNQPGNAGIRCVADTE